MKKNYSLCQLWSTVEVKPLFWKSGPPQLLIRAHICPSESSKAPLEMTLPTKKSSCQDTFDGKDDAQSNVTRERHCGRGQRPWGQITRVEDESQKRSSSRWRWAGPTYFIEGYITSASGKGWRTGCNANSRPGIWMYGYIPNSLERGKRVVFGVWLQS